MPNQNNDQVITEPLPTDLDQEKTLRELEIAIEKAKKQAKKLTKQETRRIFVES